MPTIAHRWLREVLRGEPDEAFALQCDAINCGRLRVFAPLMTLVHGAHVAYFAVTGARRAALADDIVRWRDGLVVAHGLMIPITLAGTWVVWRSRSRTLRHWVGPFAAALWLYHGAACTSLDQRVGSSINAYVGYCFGIAALYCLPPRVTLVAYVTALAAVVGGVLGVQRSQAAVTSTLPNLFTVALVGVVLAWLAHDARRREFTQRATIDRQSAELASLNAGLELRVQEQVAEIVAHAANVDRLNTELQGANAQLQAQVRARSVELSLALSRLAKTRGRDDTLRVGMVLVDRFVVGEFLGAGGMGAVYAGRDQTTGARVAIKVIQATSSRQLDSLRRFIREAGTVAAVTHPAIVRMLHLDVSDDGLLFQVQELVEGETLSRCMGRAWAAGDAARLAACLCEALAAAHAQGIVHLDVKPGNVMLTAVAPGLKLLDFGIAKLLDAAAGGDQVTRADAVLGTPTYMAPEQFLGRAEVGERADVYSAGVLLYRLLTGQLPFEAPTPRALMDLHVREPAPDVRALVPSTPDALVRVVARCLAKSPEERPSAQALASQLAAIADALEAPALERIPAQPNVVSEATRSLSLSTNFEIATTQSKEESSAAP